MAEGGAKDRPIARASLSRRCHEILGVALYDVLNGNLLTHGLE